MRKEETAVVKEALDRQKRDESFEHALGSAMRRHDLNYDSYVQVMSEIRELARKKKIDVEKAARRLTGTEAEE